MDSWAVDESSKILVVSKIHFNGNFLILSLTLNYFTFVGFVQFVLDTVHLGEPAYSKRKDMYKIYK